MTNKLFDISDKCILVTGSSRGLGLTMAKGLGAAGAKLALNGRSASTLDRAVNELKEAGWQAQGFVFDVGDRDQVCAAVEDIERVLGPIDVLINNAGIQLRAPLEDFEEADWERVIHTNLTSAFVVSKYVARKMIPRRAGKIINICSMMSELGRPSIAPYAASKGGLKMLTRAMATEWAQHNLQVNGIGPGYFASEMTKALVEDKAFSDWLCARVPAHRWGDPEELVGAAIFLSSAASNYVNGHVLYVDGGMLACV